jgi:hypothetical protein
MGIGSSHRPRLNNCSVPFYKNIRIRRVRLAKGENYRGYIASKRVYFYDLKVHIITEEKFVYEDGRSHDLEGGKREAKLSETRHAHAMNEEKREREGIGWEPVRRKGSRRFQGEEIEAWKRRARKVVETVGRALRLYFGKKVQAATLRGFLGYNNKTTQVRTCPDDGGVRS